MKNQILKGLLLCLGAVALTHCSATQSYDTSTAEVVGSAMAGAASSSDDSSGSNVAARHDLMSLLLPKAYAAACASVAKIKGQTCTGSPAENMSINLNDCTADLGYATWMGTFNLAFNSTTACSDGAAGGLLGMGSGNSAVLTSSSGVTRMVETGAYVESDSNSSGFNTPESGGLSVICNDATCGGGGAGASRSVDLIGVHRAEYGPAGGLRFDHTLNTTTALTVNGVGASKVIAAGGTVVLQHNLARFVATTVVTSPLTFSAGCCWPTGGSVTTTFSNGRDGSETLTFGPSCGNGEIGGKYGVGFTHCL